MSSLAVEASSTRSCSSGCDWNVSSGRVPKALSEGRPSEDVQVLAGLGLGIDGPHFAEDLTHPQAGRGAGATVHAGSAVAERRAAAFLHVELVPRDARVRRIVQLQANLGENADQQLVHVVVDADRRFDELALVGGGQLGALCKE